MTKAVLQTIRNGVMVIGVCASLAAGSLGFSGSAEARVPAGDRVGYSAVLCGAIQDDWDKAKKERDSATTPQERAAASEKMRIAVNAWYGNDCDDYYGRIARFELPAPEIVKNQQDVGPTGTVEAPANVGYAAGGALASGIGFASGQ